MTTVTQAQPWQRTWQKALSWGIGIALLHRLVLTIWLAGVWMMIGSQIDTSKQPLFEFGQIGSSTITTPLEQSVFGVWRRWDAGHYLTLAADGYQITDPGDSVFAPVTPVLIRLFSTVLFNNLDLGSMAMETVCFALALVFLFRLVETYYHLPEVAPWAVFLLAIWPLTYIFAAPMSEAPFLAFTVMMIYFATGDRWAIAAVCGCMATLTRTQGLFLVVVGAVALLEQTRWRSLDRQKILALARRGAFLALIPLSGLAFIVYRNSLGLPALNDVYAHSSNVVFFPLPQALIQNFTYLAQYPVDLLVRSLDGWPLLLNPIFIAFMIGQRPHRKWPLLVYTIGFFFIFVSKMNLFYGTTVPFFTQSLGRYELALFPIVIFLAHRLYKSRPVVRMSGIVVLAAVFLVYSALNALALSTP